jgi:membrane protein implicated in regulation of membrane protease activity
MFALLALLVLIFVPWPWNLAATLLSLVLFGLEVVYWQRRLREHRVQTGVENLVGATGEVTAPLSPSGQIRVLGELWAARSETPLDRGARVRVVGVRNLTLEVEPKTDSSRRGVARNGPVVLLVAAVVALAGCGGDDGPSASEDYANGVCSSLSTWVTDVQESVQSLTDAGLATSREDIQSAFDQAKDATDTLGNDLEQVGPPETEDGQEAKSQLDGLMTQLRQQLDLIQQALESGGGLTAIAATVSTAVSAAANAVNTTYQNLQGLDPAGELRDAFENSDDCNSLQDQLADIRS